MENGGPESGTRVVGRERELTALDGFLRGRPPPRTLVLTGGPGAGKTTLWEAGLTATRDRGLRVLAARPTNAVTQLAFGALIDLLDGIDRNALAGVPAPQLDALDVALLRAEPMAAPPQAPAIAVGFLNALRALAADGPLLVAVDDVQWLDQPSAEVLGSAARRLDEEPVRFLLARRTRGSSPLEAALDRGRVERIDVEPLSLGALRQLFAERFGLRPSRRLLRLIVDSTLGNPLFALELGRTLAEESGPDVPEELQVPDSVEDLLGTRVSQLQPRVRRVLLAVALDAQLDVARLAVIAEPDAPDDAVDAGVVVVDGDRVRAAHPLLAAAARSRSRAAERRQLHRELADTAGGALRARHLALAAARPDAELAAEVAEAAAAASARGARREALELAEQALRLTPRSDEHRAERIFLLVETRGKAGEGHRSIGLLKTEFDSLPQGAPRARALIVLAHGPDVRTHAEYQDHLDRALAESNGDPAVRAEVLALQANSAAAVRVAQIRDAEAWALEALEDAPSAGPDVEQLALYALAWARSYRGGPIDDLRERLAAAAASAPYLQGTLERVDCDRHAWRGEVHAARAIVMRLMALADERGEAKAYFALLSQRCEIELRAGEFDAASDLLDEWDQASSDRFVSPIYERCRAVEAAGRGDPAAAERLAAEVIPRAEAEAEGWDLLEGLRARGVAALLAHEPARAVESLGRVWEHTRREGIEDPGAFPVAPDLVEALVGTRDLDTAKAVTTRLRELAAAQQHPWGLAGADRCAALVSSDYEEAAAGLTEAAAAYGELGLRFDRARSLLILGRSERRLRKWGAARSSLEQAVAAFEEIGSPGWAAEARSDLERVGARRPQPPGELTPAEQRVVELAADGLSNKEIAQALFVAVNTVEAHLSHAYAKLGIRSRRQLGRRLLA